MPGNELLIEQEAIEIRPFSTTDEDAVLALYARGFDESWSREAWRWRFLCNPGGRAEVVSAFDESGRCLASFGGVSLPFRFGGETARANAACNIVLDPAVRTRVGGARLLIEVGRVFFDLYGGGATRMVFGCPRLDLLRVLNRHLRVETLWDVTFLVGRSWASTAPPPTDIRVRAVGEISEAVGALWRRWVESTPTCIERDPSYLHWRFVQHPTVGYRLLEAVDSTGALRGFAVTRLGGWSDEVLSVAEWMVPHDDIDTEKALVAHLRWEAREAGKHFIAAWFSPTSIEFRRFQEVHGFTCRLSPYQETFRTFSRQVNRAFLFENWFQTMGDLEFF